jgi:hypothetical protein
MARTQKNKATAGHLGLLKARLAKFRRELITPKGGGGGPGDGFDVAKTGDARIGFVGTENIGYQIIYTLKRKIVQKYLLMGLLMFRFSIGWKIDVTHYPSWCLLRSSCL